MMFVEVMLLLILLGANCTQAHIKYCSFVVWCCVLFFLSSYIRQGWRGNVIVRCVCHSVWL